MSKYDVHLYPRVRVKVCGIDAPNEEAAIHAAEIRVRDAGLERAVDQMDLHGVKYAEFDPEPGDQAIVDRVDDEGELIDYEFMRRAADFSSWLVAKAPEKRQFIKSTETIHTGGNVWNDVIELSDGQVIVICDDAVLLYPNRAASEEHDTDECAQIDRHSFTAWKGALA